MSGNKTGKKVAILTNNLICGMNKRYFSMLEKYFVSNGWIISTNFDAELVVFSACGFHDLMHGAVKASLEQLKAINFPREKIILMGCQLKTHEQELKKLFDGCIVEAGNESLLDGMIHAEVPYSSIEVTNVYNSPVEEAEREKNQLFSILIEDGCLKQCTFCVVNKARGDIKSTALNEIEAQFRLAVKAGYTKIELMGVDTFGYGYDCGTNIIELMEYLLKIEPNVKFYFGNLHIRWLNLYWEGILSLCKRGFINSLHIGLQHVNDEILIKMGRPAGFQESYKIICKFKEECPNLFITADFIVGFPGETDDMFKELRDFFEKDQCLNMFFFHEYSDIKGAPSSKFKDKVKPEKIMVRWNKLKNAAGGRNPRIALCNISESEKSYYRDAFNKKSEPGGYYFCKETYVEL